MGASAEAVREEYGFLPPTQRQRATIVKPGTMILSQPELPVPLVVQFPFPSWATRASEAAPAVGVVGAADPSTPGSAADEINNGLPWRRLSGHSAVHLGR